MKEENERKEMKRKQKTENRLKIERRDQFSMYQSLYLQRSTEAPPPRSPDWSALMGEVNSCELDHVDPGAVRRIKRGQVSCSSLLCVTNGARSGFGSRGRVRPRARGGLGLVPAAPELPANVDRAETRPEHRGGLPSHRARAPVQDQSRR